MSGINNPGGGDGGGPLYNFTYPATHDTQINVENISGTWAASAGAATTMWRRNIFQSGTPAVGNRCKRRVAVPWAGTFKVRVIYIESTDSGIFKVLVGGVDAVVDIDAYSAAGKPQNFSPEVDLGALAAGDIVEVECEVTGKNASSSNFYLTLSGFYVYEV